MGFNVIAVGAIDDYDTDNWDDDVMAEYSSFRDPVSDHGDREKPELVAVGSAKAGEKVEYGERYRENDCWMKSTLMSSPWVGTVWLGRGTSYSAPAVAGAAALLMQENWILKTWPETIKAVLMASAVHNVEGESRLSEYDGTGAVVLSVAHETVGLGRWRNRTAYPDSFPITYQFYASRGQRVRIAMAWDSWTEHAHPPTQDVLKADLDLKVFDPNNYLVESSPSFDNPYEIVDFVAPVSGTYTAYVTKHRFEGDYEYLGFAYSLMDFLERSETKFGLDNLYKAHLSGYLYLYRGSMLVAVFYTYDNAFQAKTLVWSEQTLPYAYFNTAVPHPQAKPVERVRLVLTDTAGNEIATIATFTVTRSELSGRISKIRLMWRGGTSGDRSLWGAEVAKIRLRWRGTPA